MREALWSWKFLDRSCDTPMLAARFRTFISAQGSSTTLSVPNGHRVIS